MFIFWPGFGRVNTQVGPYSLGFQIFQRGPWNLGLTPDQKLSLLPDNLRWRVRDGTVVRHIGTEGGAPGQFNCPMAVTVPAHLTGTAEAWLVVADSRNRRVQVWRAQGLQCECY